MLLKNDKIETAQTEGTSSDVGDKQRTLHVEDTPMKGNLSDSNDVITVICAYFLCFLKTSNRLLVCVRAKTLPFNAAVLTSRITVLARPSMCLSVPYGLLSREHTKQKDRNLCECLLGKTDQCVIFLL